MFYYYKVAVIDGDILNLDTYPYIVESLQNTDTERWVKVKEECPAGEGWREVTEAEYNEFKETYFQTPPENTDPSLEEKIAQLQNDNLILMDALATTFEELLVLGEKVESLGGVP